MQRIALFGGSFNPIHLGHLLMARAAVEELGLTRLYFVPAAQSPFKPDLQLAAAAERIRLLRLALAGHPEFTVDPGEIGRGGISYSIDTVRQYQAAFPASELWYLIGSDHAPLLPQWRAAEELAERVQFAVFPRPGMEGETLPAPFRGRVLCGPGFDVSASQIRERVRTRRSIEWLVPAAVAEAICNNHLYL